MIDWISRPVLPCCRCGGRHGPYWFHIRPMRLKVGTLLDPASQYDDFLGRKRLAEFRGRHPLRFVGMSYPSNQFAGVQIARHNRGRTRFQCGRCTLGIIQPQARLALFFVRAVTGKAFIGKNRSNIAIKINRRFR